METIKYPVDTASFRRIRENGYLYVDKTAYIHSLVNNGIFYFLARPRRFGKSLLIDTMEEYFKGERDLFTGLEIDRLEPSDWKSYPVLHFNLSGEVYDSAEALDKTLGNYLSDYEKEFGIEPSDASLASRFLNLIKGIAVKTSENVVILFDEYDVPLSDNIGNRTLHEELQKRMHAFYSVLKKADKYIRFCFLTGVTRYGKVSVFSGLNNLNDITFDSEYAGICGVTEKELHEYYKRGIAVFAEKNGLSVDDAFRQLKFHYDGYHFNKELEDIYNPYSINYALQKCQIKDYWCETGAPTILIEQLKEMDFDIDKLEGSQIYESDISNLTRFASNPIPLLFQTGYLTIKGYDSIDEYYTLGYPNREVEKGFFRNILQVYVPNEKNPGAVIGSLRMALRDGNPEAFVEKLKVYLSSIPPQLHRIVGKYENYYHTVIYCLLDLIGMDVNAEFGASNGYIDLLVETSAYIYIIELKVNGTAKDAMDQIERKNYSLPFSEDKRRIYKIGLGLSKTTNNIESFLIKTN